MAPFSKRQSGAAAQVKVQSLRSCETKHAELHDSIPRRLERRTRMSRPGRRTTSATLTLCKDRRTVSGSLCSPHSYSDRHPFLQGPCPPSRSPEFDARHGCSSSTMSRTRSLPEASLTVRPSQSPLITRKAQPPDVLRQDRGDLRAGGTTLLDARPDVDGRAGW